MAADEPTWTRADAVHRLEGEFDVVVVGGGITGAGTALDLSARGLRVALVERADFAQGTSSRSTKLFHGGIRYLPQLRLGMISEALREQKVLARIADFLYDPLEFIIPLYRQYRLAGAPAWAAGQHTAPLALRAGLVAYDILGGPGRPGAGHRRLSPDEVVAMVPTLRRQGLRHGFVYRDAQTDDARLVVTVAKTAVRRHGAVAAGGMEATSVQRDKGGFRLSLLDRHTGDRVAVWARAVVAATGALDPPPMPGVAAPRLVRSKGVHLLLDPDSLGVGERALVLPETEDGRVLYVIPWAGVAMAGTTDTPYSGDPIHPRGEPEDVAYLLRHLSRYLDTGPLRPISVFAGLRTLADVGAGTTAEASREHLVTHPVPGYVRVSGGKLTTYRRVAAEVSDVISTHLGLARSSSTSALPLLGAGGDRPTMVSRLREAGLPDGAAAAAVDRYGTEVERIARTAQGEPALTAVLGDDRTSLAEVAHAVEHEAAATPADVMLRRTRLAWLTVDHGRGDAAAVIRTMGTRLGWDRRRMEQERENLEEVLVAEGL